MVQHKIMDIHAPEGKRVVYCHYDPSIKCLILDRRYTVLQTKQNAFCAQVELKEFPKIFFPCRLFRNAREKKKSTLKEVMG